MLKVDLIGNPKWGQNVIDKVNMKIFMPPRSKIGEHIVFVLSVIL